MNRIRNLIIWSAGLVLALALLLTAGTLAAHASESGSAGDLSWTLDGSGTLTVSGSGVMPDYSDPDETPWSECRDEIRAVVVKDGVENVGYAAFYECESLTSVSLAESVTDVGDYAFAECSSLLSAEMSGVTSIGRDAFRYCTSLTVIGLPETLTSLGTEAFYRCESLLAVTVPSSVTEMGSSVFAYCSGLAQADIGASVSTLPTWTFYSCNSLGAVALSESITSAGEKAFYGCESLTSLACAEGSANTLLAAAQGDGAPIDEDGVKDYDGSVLYTYRDTEEEEVEDGVYRIRSYGVLSQSGCVISDEILYLLDMEDREITSESRTVSMTVINAEGLSALIEYLSIIDGTATSEELTGVIDAEMAAVDAIELMMTGGETALTGEFLEAVADSGADLKVTMENGVIWEMENDDLAGTSFYDSYDMSAEVTAKEKVGFRWKRILKGAEAFQLSFGSDVNFQCSVSLPFGSGHAGGVVSLFAGRDSTPLQSVYAGQSGLVTFWFSNINSSRTYMTGIDVEGVDVSTALISADDAANYGDELITYDSYVVTGTTSSLPFSLVQMILMAVGAMAAAVVVVAVVMTRLNKRKKEKLAAEELLPESGESETEELTAQNEEVSAEGGAGQTVI
ncbi:MAG: leucine-rich repeat domain-containing protein [Clostridiales bacterium]|nr:leucine-rich repeat domain-containing protein [Clostridiales bacterium]